MKYLIYTTAALVTFSLLAGMATFIFTETQGIISAVSKAEVKGAGYPTQKAGAKGYGGDKKTILNVRYEYVVDDKKLNNSIVAFWLIDSPEESFSVGQRVKVFYFPFYPKIAVLKTGPDKLLLLSVIVLIIGWLSLRSLFRRSIGELQQDR